MYKERRSGGSKVEERERLEYLCGDYARMIGRTEERVASRVLEGGSGRFCGLRLEGVFVMEASVILVGMADMYKCI